MSISFRYIGRVYRTDICLPRRRHAVQPAGIMGVDHLAAVSVEHHAPVVHRVMEGAPREDERVDDRGDDTDLGAAGDRPPGTSGARAMQVEGVPDPRVDRGKRPGPAVAVGPGDVADQGLIQDRLDRVAVVRGSFGEPVDAGALGGSLGHAGMLPGVAPVALVVLRQPTCSCIRRAARSSAASTGLPIATTRTTLPTARN